MWFLSIWVFGPQEKICSVFEVRKTLHKGTKPNVVDDLPAAVIGNFADGKNVSPVDTELSEEILLQWRRPYTCVWISVYSIQHIFFNMGILVDLASTP